MVKKPKTNSIKECKKTSPTCKRKLVVKKKMENILLASAPSKLQQFGNYERFLRHLLSNDDVDCEPVD